VSQELTPERVRSADLVLITTAHAAVDYAMVVREAKRVLDTRNAVGHHRAPNVERL
jgi:UDP-N-acetyl-D-glucosamine dehydrogenase